VCPSFPPQQAEANPRPELMSYAGEDGPQRQRDDETQAYLMQFFREVAAKPGFVELFEALTPDEKDKLRSFG
jgi:importin-9